MATAARTRKETQKLAHPVAGAGVQLQEVREQLLAQATPHRSIQAPGRAVVVGVPATGDASELVCVGVPVNPYGEVPPPSYTELHGEISAGVGEDMVGAEQAARISARRDNAAFVERKRFTEAQARSRADAEEKAIDIARYNARRRDAEGLAMRPHPGNRLEPEPSLYGEKAGAYLGGPDDEAGRDKSKEKEEREDAGEGVYAPGGYQCAEYQPAEYDCAEYKSVYDAPK